MIARLTRWGVSAALILGCIIAVSVAATADAAARPKKAPAQYKSSGHFAGGDELAGCVLSGIRFGKHSGFLRIVLDFSVGSRGAPKHPPYRIEYRTFPYRFRVTFEGVKYAEDAHVDTLHAVPLSIVTNAENDIQLMELFITGPALFKVIEVDDPAKLALDVKYLPSETVPLVYAVQLQDIADVQTAFSLIEQEDLPPGFSPDIIVIGNAVFVEDAYLTLEEAAAVVARLDDAGYPAMVTERLGNELPRY
jgi:hypothetical protein